MTDISQLRTVKQLAAELRGTGGFSESSLRWMLFNRERNGLDKAVVRLGRRVFIDAKQFSAWLERQR